MWTCPKCAAKVDPGFEVCWQCGTTRDGVEDPSFVSADDAGPILDPVMDGEATLAPIPLDDDLVAPAPSGNLVPCYQAYSLMEAKFLADELVAEGIPALSDTQDLQDEIGGWSGNPKVYVNSPDLPRARAWLEAYEERKKTGHGPALEQ